MASQPEQKWSACTRQGVTGTVRPAQLLWACATIAFFPLSRASAFELNQDGQALIREATQAHLTDTKDRPLVVDPLIKAYVAGVAKRVKPSGKPPPPGVAPSITVIDSPRPEIYSYMDGHTLITTGMLYAMNNEAQVACVLAPELAHLVEGYYINAYQEIKAEEKKQRRKGAAGAVFGSLYDSAVDYAVWMGASELTGRWYSSEYTYRQAVIRINAVYAAHDAYYNIQDVIRSLPPKDKNGNWIDPRIRFQAVADAQGMEYVALAGYDASECANAWTNVLGIHNRLAREAEQAYGQWAAEMRDYEQLRQQAFARARQALGVSGLTQTVSDVPATRVEFVAKLVDLNEVQEAQKAHGRDKGRAAYVSFLERVLLPQANQALKDEHYDQAYIRYQALYENGVRTAPVLYGLARGRLGKFAFGAPEEAKEEAEARYKAALAQDRKYTKAYLGLAELYEDWDRYEDAVKTYRKYLKAVPKASDRKKVERRIRVLQQKADR